MSLCALEHACIGLMRYTNKLLLLLLLLYYSYSEQYIKYGMKGRGGPKYIMAEHI